MLYDNALLVRAYLDAFAVTGRDEFAVVAREILRYAQRKMTSPQGGFYSATDADSKNVAGHTEEGAFFTWTPDELNKALGEKQSAIVRAYYQVEDKGNFEGRTILSTPRPRQAIATELNMSVSELRHIVFLAREVLYSERARRPPPLLDDKILASWNGMMISAFAHAARVFGLETREGAHYAEVAKRAADFVLTKMQREGRLFRSYRNGQAHLSAYLEDYANVACALIDLFEMTGQARWMDSAIALDRTLQKHFEDTKGGGGFFSRQRRS